MRVICSLLGVPEADRATFTAWSASVARVVEPPILRSPEVEAEIERDERALAAYFGELIERRRRDPGDDQLSAVVAAEAEQRPHQAAGGGRHRHAPAGGGPRDHDEPDRQRHAGAAARARPARPPSPIAGAGIGRGRRAAALRLAPAGHPPGGAGGYRALWPSGEGRLRADADPGRRQPRPGRLRRARIASTSRAMPAATSPSAAVSTIAWASRWPAWRA